ncbi:hypothetical protein Skr01_42950 [Sphaerisporangium krabiense]|uniref:Uncharacterized protein n=1 Tax=Sphaerisporangium krabiense TaxID=763782 RepID=A0A7W8Z0L2_9ACTN|nr:transporter [Sphaerisporangium krabiense]MBB5625274.1 hypothetical protein [Sphaerisporangium krabiense]GII64210.1 hypothetical protein Skr01_42950 [Sphaerisporangium krabiense]
MNRLEDDDGPLTPEETLRIIEEQRASTVRRLGGDPLLMHAPWGVAWLTGFGALFAHYAYGVISSNAAITVLFAGMMLAMAVTAYAQSRMAGRVRGQSSHRGMMYGLAWGFGYASVIAIDIRLSPLLPPDEVGLLWAVTSMALVAALYVAGGAIWRDWTMFFLGTGIAVLNLVGAVAGPTVHALLMCAGGGGFLVVGVARRLRRAT